MNSKQDKISTMSEIKYFKEFPTRDDYFANVISENKYYADKSLYLKSVFENDGSAMLLFTRPRWFGQTLLMNMVADFLRIKDSVKGDKQDISIDHFYAYAIAFSNKYCRVKIEKLK